MFLFDIGAPVQSISRRTRGEWGFLFESCEWIFQAGLAHQGISSSDHRDHIEAAFEAMRLGNVEEANFSIDSGTLSINFSSGWRLTVSPYTEEEDIEATEWMLFIPNELVWTKTKTALTCGSSHAL
jgi:hypothetical protein